MEKLERYDEWWKAIESMVSKLLFLDFFFFFSWQQYRRQWTMKFDDSMVWPWNIIRARYSIDASRAETTTLIHYFLLIATWLDVMWNAATRIISSFLFECMEVIVLWFMSGSPMPKSQLNSFNVRCETRGNSVHHHYRYTETINAAKESLCVKTRQIDRSDLLRSSRQHKPRFSCGNLYSQVSFASCSPMRNAVQLCMIHSMMINAKMRLEPVFRMPSPSLSPPYI